MSYNAKVYMKQGGDEMVVNAGGKITAAGTQASAITAVKADYATPGLDSEAKIIAAVNLQAAAINAIIAALKGVGIVA